MSNLHPPDYEPQLSDIRSSSFATAPIHSPNWQHRLGPPRIGHARRGSPSSVSRSRTRSSRLLHAVMNQDRHLVSPPSGSGSEERERSNKRRRTTISSPQSEEMQLPMELRFCDGGRYEGTRAQFYSYVPDNVLEDDETVYCTKNSLCNLILRHEDGACFTLSRLVIRAPPDGYTSPVREGMIFVSMDDSDLLCRTQRFTIPRNSSDSDSDSDGHDSSEDDLLDSDPCNILDNLSSSVDVDLVNRYSVTGPSTAASWVSPGEIDNTPRAPLGPSRLRDSYSSLSRWANLDGQISRPPPPEPLEPSKTFYHKDRHTPCEIIFDPPISGRYILAKFFSPHREKNIDIQFIGAYGFVGRRCFPAITPR